MARRVRGHETAASLIVQHFNLDGEVEAAKNARRAEGAEKSAKFGKNMAAFVSDYAQNHVAALLICPQP